MAHRICPLIAISNGKQLLAATMALQELPPSAAALS